MYYRNKQVKVLFFVRNLKARGVQRQILYLLKGLTKKGEVTPILFVEKPEGEFLDEIPNGVKICLPKSSRPKRFRSFWRFKEIMNLISKENPDLLCSRHTSSLDITTALAGILTGKKIVFVRSISTTHYKYQGTTRAKLYLLKKAYNLADQIAVVAKGMADDLEVFFKVNPSKIRVIHNGYEIEEIQKQSRENAYHQWFNESEPIAVAVGRLEIQKGYNYLLGAIKLVNEKIPLKLLILGDGEMKEELKIRARELGIEDKVDFLGTKKNPFAYMGRCDLFVLSSLYEGFPNVLVEAMALGLPVISTNCPHGPNEIIEDGRNGILVPVENPQAIAEAILRVLGDKQLREELRIQAKRKAKDFSLEDMVSKYAELFLSLSGRI